MLDGAGRDHRRVQVYLKTPLVNRGIHFSFKPPTEGENRPPNNSRNPVVFLILSYTSFTYEIVW